MLLSDVNHIGQCPVLTPFSLSICVNTSHGVNTSHEVDPIEYNWTVSCSILRWPVPAEGPWGSTPCSLGSQPPVCIPPPWPRHDIQLILSQVRDIVDKVWLDPYPLVLCHSQFLAGQY